MHMLILGLASLAVSGAILHPAEGQERKEKGSVRGFVKHAMRAHAVAGAGALLQMWDLRTGKMTRDLRVPFELRIPNHR